MLEMLGEHMSVALIGAIGGVVLGLAARLGRFCTLGAIEDYIYGGGPQRLQMWAMATGVAILTSFALLALDLLSLGDVFYLTESWNPLASVLGGLTFGYGMAIAGNCGFGALARLGGGDMRAFVIIIIIGIAAYVMASGPLAPLRIWLFPPGVADLPQSFATLIAGWSGLSPAIVGTSVGLAIICAILGFTDLTRARGPLAWSIAIGLAIAGGWAGTAHVAAHGFEATPVVSHTFSTPVGDTLLYAMLSSGLTVSFGLGSVVGVVVGAGIGSLYRGQFRWEACDDPRELRRQMTGAWLMGFGSVISLGCSVGQGLSAMSLLAYSAPVTLLAIFAGAWLGLRQLVEGFAPAE